MNKENKMGVMPVNKLLISMALPMMISMLVQALYNVVDSIFVAKICQDALTAVSMAFPMQNLMIAVGSGLGVGTNALLSRSLGERNSREASHFALHGIFLAIISYVVFLFLGLSISKLFFQLQDAKPSVAEFGHSYLSIIMCFSFGAFGQMIFERLLQSTGKTIFSMITQMTGAVINLLLDPILIFGLLGFPKLGIAGAAIATVTGQIVAGFLALVFNLKVNHEINFSLKGFKLSISAIGKILYIGVPSIIMIAISSITTFGVNKILGKFTDTAVAVFGAYFKLQSFAFMPVFGLNSGMIPIIAYNYGARKPERLMKTYKLALIYAISIMLIALITIQIFPKESLLLFSASDEMLQIGIPALRTISLSFIFAGICVISSSFFQALGNGFYSMITSIARQLIFLLPMAYLFAQTGNLNNVWFSWPLAELVSLAVSIFYVRKIYIHNIKPAYH